MTLRKFKEMDKKFVKLDILDEILKNVKDYLPEDLKYIKLRSTQFLNHYELDLDFYNSGWGKIFNFEETDFSEEEIDKFEDMCSHDYISNSLVGLNGALIDDYYRKVIEVDDKIKPGQDYYYEYKK